MNKITFTLVLSTCLFFGKAFAQQTDSLQQKHIAHLKKELSVTDAQAKQVVAIMDDYKAKAKTIVGNTSLSQEEKRAKFDALIADKNSKLEKLLTEQQLQKIVPTTERAKGKAKN